MPDVRIKFGDGSEGILSVAGEYKAGDPPPVGYCDWHDWAAVQEKAGLRQVRCGRCSLYRYPQELSGLVDAGKVMDRHGREIETRSPVCLGCAAKAGRAGATESNG